MSRATLEARRKQLRSMGKGQKPNASSSLSDGDEEQLFVTNQLQFGMRGRDEHHKLRYGDLQLKTDENGTEYVEWCFERGTKTRNGEGTGCLGIRQFKPKMFTTESSRYTVHHFKAYLSHRPSSSNTPESHFYLNVHHHRPENSTEWNKNQPMGKNTLGRFMISTALASGLKEKKLANHSVRKTMIQ